MNNKERLNIATFARHLLQSQGWGAFVACFNSSISGHPRWLAKYVEGGLCRIKWAASAAIILWVIQGANLNHLAVNDYISAAETFSKSDPASIVPTLIWGSLSIGILCSLFGIFLSQRKLTLVNAQWLLSFVILGMLISQALLLGFSHFDFKRVISFDLHLLVLCSIAPLKLTAIMPLIAAGLSMVVISSVLTGNAFELNQLLFLTHPLSFAVIGVVVNRWQLRAFKAEWLSGVRLSRRTFQLERKNAQIELQMEKVEQQRTEIEIQRGQLFQALTSALTGPVAKSYLEERIFRPELKTVCVIACDAVGFSEMCKKLQPDRVISELENFFREFDSACFKFQVEPLRAQGDSRIAISGLWADDGHELHHAAIKAVLAMLVFRRTLPEYNKETGDFDGGNVLWPARMGISLGAVACGVIDTSHRTKNTKSNTLTNDALKLENGNTPEPQSDTSSSHKQTMEATSGGRLWFDVWGDTVNIAARLEQGAQTNQILVRESVLWETRGLFDHGPIQSLQVKSTLIPDVAEIIGIRPEYCDLNGQPNDVFWQVYNDNQMRPAKPDQYGTVRNPNAS